MDEPISPTAALYTVIKPSVPYAPRKPRIKSPSPSPPNLGCNTSLIDLKDWVVEDGPASKLRPLQPTENGNGMSKYVVAPPLPPRKASQNSVEFATTSHQSQAPHNASLTISRSSSNSLTVEHTYPPLLKMSSNTDMRQRQGHVPASSMSSFHSVSLSSDGDVATDGTGIDGGSSVLNFIATYPMDREENSAEIDRNRDSVDDSFSFETVSSTGISSPTLSSTHEWEKDFATQSIKLEPPKLPSRRIPLAKPPSSSSSSSPSLSPPIPSSQKPSQPSSPTFATSASDRSSIFSTGTITTAHTSIGSYTQLLRPTPVPLVARKRYEAVFFANVNARRRANVNKLSVSTSEGSASLAPASPTTPRKGWRGLSVDLITNPEDNPVFSVELEEETEGGRLEGQIVKTIWLKSKLLPEKLRDIWNECALPNRNFLDKDEFIKGMWRIDEELRRVQSSRSSSLPITSRLPKRTETLLH
ncbi:hypothetical protein EW145_g1441 [Phellinidium pouzarii]|uniref:EH domain-containing protein n=1 Tax=Phellinidium pouzarii TaxID=167371 RepID=A0A4S4LEH8_9AGAM|nr:hypothetical protein EW145_g1441 [Phellinidium pouzarii]